MDQPKIERVLRLMKMMTGANRYSVEELAERLGTSYRSIYRYIDTFKEVGFVVHKEEGAVYRLGKESPYFKDISQLIHFTDEEAHIVNQLIGALDDTNMLKQNLRRKLSSVYNCTSLANSIVKGKNAENVNRIIEAIEERRQVILHDYSSSHTSSKRDRLIEPVAFTTNYVQIWSFDTSDGKMKLFNTARIGEVEILDTEWQNEAEHRSGHIDIFRNMGFEQKRVQLRLGVMSRNLLTEEYPLAERDLHQEDERHWLLDTMVCNYAGVGRFVMGLIDDIEIIDSPELTAYLRSKLEQASAKL
ncbi:MAG: WYL domain-containing protein [Alistipes sp.]|nr:WYL domain-containing protein [Alistipes sp.]MBQ3027206.1 WYL domain-containing protein [Alistipes sp.]